MPTEIETYERHALEYEDLVSREDYQGNILKTIREIVPLDGLDVLDLGAGTGRLAGLLGPYARTVLALDLSIHMLGLAHEKLRSLGRGKWLIAAADHRRLPLKARSVDLIVSGWSVSYVAVWHPDRWRSEAGAWYEEACRLLRPGGHLILFESLGTGTEEPTRLAHLENFYDWLDETGFQQRWIRTDYKFESAELGVGLAGFFFGNEMKEKIIRNRLTVLPECTGVWWMRLPSA